MYLRGEDLVTSYIVLRVLLVLGVSFEKALGKFMQLLFITGRIHIFLKWFCHQTLKLSAKLASHPIINKT